MPSDAIVPLRLATDCQAPRPSGSRSRACQSILLRGLFGLAIVAVGPVGWAQMEEAAPLPAQVPTLPDSGLPEEAVSPARNLRDTIESPPLDGNPTSLVDATRDETEEYYQLLHLFTNTLHEIDRNYVQKISRRELIEAALEGMMRKLDAHSSYIPPDQFDDMKSEVESEFGGIGVRIAPRGGALRVISPLYDTPAYRAGILAGDAILAIDGASTEGMTTDEAVRRLKGTVGSRVQLVVQHIVAQESVTLDIPREIVRVQTVLGARRRADHSWDFLLDPVAKIGYVRITTFGRYTGQELRDALLQLREQAMTGLILDLRFNPGGLLSAAVEVADLFLARGKIVSTAGRNVEPHSWDALPDGTFEGFRMAILVNRYSASASEIVSAALQDHGRGVVVGERTWGKASVQNIIELEGGKSAIKLTTAGYQRPSGKNIQRFHDSSHEEWGVQPDPNFLVQVTDQEIVSLRQQQAELDILRHPSLAPSSAAENRSTDRPATDEVPATFVDRQLAKALEYLRTPVTP